MAGPLAGRRIGVTADRKREAQRTLLEARGATVVEGPTMATRYLVDDPALRATTDELVQSPPDTFIADTGVGVRAWVDAADTWGLGGGLRSSLATAQVLARGAKAASAVRRLTGITATVSPDSRLDGFRDLLATAGLAGRRVAVQRSGPDDEPFLDWLRGGGAVVTSIEVYRWELPADHEPAWELIRQAVTGQLDAVTFTSAPGVDNLFVLAKQLGEAERLRYAFTEGLVAACVGSVCAGAVRRQGIASCVYPDSGHLPDMIRKLTEVLGAAV